MVQKLNEIKQWGMKLKNKINQENGNKKKSSNQKNKDQIWY
jgi:hypothetical protein